MNTRLQTVSRSLLRAPRLLQAVCRIHSRAPAKQPPTHDEGEQPARVLPPKIYIREDDKNLKDFIPPQEFAETTFNDFMNAQETAVKKGLEKVLFEKGKKVSPAIYALVARIGLQVENWNVMEQILQRNVTVDRYSLLGETSLELYAGEYLHLKYPQLHARSMNLLLQAYVGNASLTALGYEWGLNHIGSLKKLTDLVPDEVAIDDMGYAVKCIIGLLYSEKGAEHTRQFIHSHILSRTVDPNSTLTLIDPKRMLIHLITRQKGEKPVARLLKESGRITNNPIFVVGAFSGTRKLGEGYGSSLKMAEFGANKDALRKHYLKEQFKFQLPSDTQISPAASFTPTAIGDTPAIE